MGPNPDGVGCETTALVSRKLAIESIPQINVSDSSEFVSLVEEIDALCNELGVVLSELSDRDLTGVLHTSWRDAVSGPTRRSSTCQNSTLNSLQK